MNRMYTKEERERILETAKKHGWIPQNETDKEKADRIDQEEKEMMKFFVNEIVTENSSSSKVVYISAILLMIFGFIASFVGKFVS